jgi:hypothetical protein
MILANLTRAAFIAAVVLITTSPAMAHRVTEPGGGNPHATASSASDQDEAYLILDTPADHNTSVHAHENASAKTGLLAIAGFVALILLGASK